VPQVVNADVLDAGRFGERAELLPKVPAVRPLRFRESRGRSRREEVLVAVVRGQRLQRLDDRLLGLSQDAVGKKVGLSRSLIAQIELANRPVTADELEKFAQLYVEPTGTRVATDDPVTVALLNLAPALLKEFDMQSRIHGVLGALMTTLELDRLLERPARTGPPTYPLPSPRTLADAIRQGEAIAEQERQRLGLRDTPVPELPDLCAAQGVPVFAVKLPVWHHLQADRVTAARIGADPGIGPQASLEAKVRRACAGVPGHPGSRVRPRVVAIALEPGRRVV
jgi:transcriptional regulator with XRE-family HTH domain